MGENKMMNQNLGAIQLFELLKKANELKLRKEYETASTLYMQAIGEFGGSVEILVSQHLTVVNYTTFR